MLSYRWVPGTCPSEDAIARMRLHFGKPTLPMGEAWFMGRKRSMYTRLMEKPLAETRVEYLTQALREIASGIKAFGHLSEWDDWFRYLLPDLALRGHERYAFDRLMEHTVTTAIAVFWRGLDAEYARFRDDALAAVPISLMHPELWAVDAASPTDATKRIPLFLLEEHDGRLFAEIWGLQKARPELSAALLFCLKYLRPAEIPEWVASLMRIEHPHWRAALLVWLLGAQDLLRAELPLPSMLESSAPEIGWEASHLLGSSHGSVDAEYPPAEAFNDNDGFLEPATVHAFWSEVRSHLSSDTLAEWEQQLWGEPRLATIRGMPELVERITRAVAA